MKFISRDRVYKLENGVLMVHDCIFKHQSKLNLSIESIPQKSVSNLGQHFLDHGGKTKDYF